MASITKQGQLTLPKSVRKHLKINEPDLIGFRLTEDKAELIAIEVKQKVGVLKN